MARDDSILYSGITSASSEPKTPREVQRQEKENARIKLKPAVDEVLALLEAEKAKLFDIRYMFFDEKTPEDEIRIEKILRQRHERLINLLEQKIKSIMTVKPKKEQSNG